MFGKKMFAIITSMALAVLAGRAGGQDVLFSDTFSIQEGSRPSGWRAVSAPSTPRFWFGYDGQLASGPGQDLGGDGYSYAVINAEGAGSWTDYGISTNFWMQSRNGQVVLTGRWQDVDNHYEARVWAFQNSRSAYIDLVRNGERTNLAYGVSGVGLNIPAFEDGSRDAMYNLQLRMVGSSLALYLNGRRILEAADNTFKSGPAGVGVQYASAYFDDVVVERARVTGPTAPIPTPRAAASGAEQVYRFLMGTYPTERQAQQRRSDLVARGYINVSIEQAGQQWDVLAGAFGSRAEAEQERKYLESQGVTPPQIVMRSAGTTQILPVARRRATPSDVAYTLVLAENAGAQEAQALKNRLQLDGFFGARVEPQNGAFRVLLGSFRTRQDAERYQTLLEGANFPVREIAETEPTEAPGPGIITPSEVSMAIQQSPVWKTLTDEQRAEFQKIVQIGGAGEQVDPEAYYADLKEALERVRIETREEINKVVEEVEQRRTTEQQVASLISRATDAVDEGNFDQARAMLDKVREIDPDNTLVGLIQQQIQLREEAIGEAIEQRLTAAQQDRLSREIAAARQRANRFQQEGLYQNALMEYQSVLDLLERYNMDQPMQADIRQKIDSVRQQIELGEQNLAERFEEIDSGIRSIGGQIRTVSEGQDEIRTAQSETGKYILILLVGFGILVILFLWIFFGVRRRNKLLLEQMRSLTLKPMMEISGAGGQAAISGGQRKGAGEIGGGAPTAIGGPAEPSVEPSKPSDDGYSSSFDIFSPQETDSLLMPEEETKTEEPPAEKEEKIEKKPEAKEARPEPKPEPEPETPKREERRAAVESDSGLSSLLMGEPEEDEEESVLETEEEKVGHRIPTVSEEPDTDVSLRLHEESPEPAPTVVGGEEEEEESPFSMLEESEEEPTSKIPAELHGPTEEEDPQQQDFKISLDETEEDESKPAAAKAGKPTDIADLDVDLDSLSLDEEDEKKPAMAAAPPVEEEEPETTPLDLDLMGVGAPEIEEDEEKETAPAAEKESGIFLKQTFDDEKTGEMPDSWASGEGEYSYASLQVADETPAGDSGKYLCFAKEDGKGSAYYSCKFPDATGLVEVQFDLRCDQKNKFLLGFYVEKDADFRQSIHTIIHQPDSAGSASLRVQGEAIPYEMGTWRRVKYVVNLSTGRLSGYVDGEKVLDDIRLTNCPRSLNTLSIRDNIPTTGVLLIDNIKIARG